LPVALVPPRIQVDDRVINLHLFASARSSGGRLTTDTLQAGGSAHPDLSAASGLERIGGAAIPQSHVLRAGARRLLRFGKLRGLAVERCQATLLLGQERGAFFAGTRGDALNDSGKRPLALFPPAGSAGEPRSVTSQAPAGQAAD